MYATKKATRARPSLSTFVRAPTTQSKQATYSLSPCDQLSATTASARALFFKDQRFDAGALQRCIELILDDMPFLCGRILPVQGLKLGSVHIALSNEGVLLTVAEASEVTMAEVGPDSWAMKGITLSNPTIPCYLDKLDGGRVLKGKEPLMKVRLTQLVDGDVLGITLSHCITDGMRWPAFLAHFAARYRQVATGIEPPSELLLRPVDRSMLSSAKFSAELHEDLEPYSLSKPQPNLSPSLGDYWRAGSVLMRDSYKKKDLVILYLPKSRIQHLKAEVLASASRNQAITTGDVVQAFSGMLVNAAQGAPLLPFAPKYQVVLVQLQGVDRNYFGNSVHLLPVQLMDGAAARAARDFKGAVAELASLIRSATVDFRARPEASVEALLQLEQLVNTPIHRMLGWLAGHRLPNVCCTTNYIGTLPADKDLDFGFGSGPSAMRWLVTPFGSDMAVIRPAMPPYGEGMFIHIPLSATNLRRLQMHPLLSALAPEAKFIGREYECRVE